jgi:hypothetical protein
MKALTILQPFSHLIVTGVKWVENRTWKPPENLVGQRIAIHAGKSREMLADGYFEEPGDAERYPDMAFGAFEGTALLWGYETDKLIKDGKFDKEWPALRTHEHVHGPWCWIFKDVIRFIGPVDCPGKQGLWDVPEHVLAEFPEKA